MNAVYVIGYHFDILGRREVHTEVRVFGKDFWFEKFGAKEATATDDKPGFTLDKRK